MKNRKFVSLGRRACCLGLVLSGVLPAQQTVTIDVAIDELPLIDGAGDPVEGSYMLTGQSAFLQYRVSSGTSGGQLDGVATPGTSISFDEVFPEPDLNNYLEFAYFGRVISYDENGAPFDTSLVMAFVPGEGVGMRIDDYFTYTEAELVTAMDSFDSPEFLDMLTNQMPGTSAVRGIITVPPLGRVGDTLDLVAFTGGIDGDLGFKIGSIGMSVVPEPGALVMGLAGLGLCLVRRRVVRAD